MSDESDNGNTRDSALGAVNRGSLEAGCPMAKRLKLDTGYEMNYTKDIDSNDDGNEQLIEKLKEFQVLDEIEGDDEGEDGE